MKNHTPLPSDLEEGEQTPSLHSKRQEQLKKELQQKYKQNESWKVVIPVCILVCVVILIGIAYLIINKIQGSLQDRIDIDTQIISISVTKIDYLNNTIILCTNNEPCITTCKFAKEHYDIDRHECEYEDYLHALKIISMVLGIIIICSCISEACGSKKTSN